MPTTANGTAYTTTTTDLGAPHGVMHYTIADAHTGDSGIPTVLYAHGAGGVSDQMVTLSQWATMRDWLIDNGWCIVEGSGGSENGAQNWGNVAARAAYPAYLAQAEGVLNLGTVVLLGRSMGGLVTAWLYANDTAGRYSGWINNSGVSTLLIGTSSGSHNADANSAYYFSPTSYTAWGVSTYGAMVTALNAADAVPEAWPSSAWTGKNILCLYGDADTTVPWSPRGAETLRTIWAGEPAIDDVHMRPGGGHGGANSSYYDVAQMSAFLLTVIGEEPEPPADPVMYRIIAAYTQIAGERYALSF